MDSLKFYNPLDCLRGFKLTLPALSGFLHDLQVDLHTLQASFTLYSQMLSSAKNGLFQASFALYSQMLSSAKNGLFQASYTLGVITVPYTIYGVRNTFQAFAVLQNHLRISKRIFKCIAKGKAGLPSLYQPPTRIAWVKIASYFLQGIQTNTPYYTLSQSQNGVLLALWGIKTDFTEALQASYKFLGQKTASYTTCGNQD